MAAASSLSSDIHPYAEAVRITVKQGGLKIEVHPTSQVRAEAALLSRNGQIFTDFMDFHELFQRPFKVLGPCNNVTHENLIHLFNFVIQNRHLVRDPKKTFEDPQSGLVFRFLPENSLASAASSSLMTEADPQESTPVFFVCPINYSRINICYEQANNEERSYLGKLFADARVLFVVKRFSERWQRHFVVMGPCRAMNYASLSRLFSLAAAGNLAKHKDGSIFDAATKLALYFIPHETFDSMDKNIKDLDQFEQLWSQYKALAEQNPSAFLTLSPIVLNLLSPAIASRYSVTLLGSDFLKIHHALEAYRSGGSFVDATVELALASPYEEEFTISRTLNRIVPEAAACRMAIQPTVPQGLEPKLSSFSSSVTEKTVYDLEREGAFSETGFSMEALTKAL